jgi:spore germination protein GerM
VSGPVRPARLSGAVLTALLAVVVLLAGACSAPVDSGPKAIREASIPLGLRSETSSTTVTTAPTGATVEVTVYFINREERLQAVTRQVSAPATVEKVLQKLFAGPNRSEAENAGLRTAISDETAILSAEVKNQIVTVDTSKYFPFGDLPDQITAFAQVVFTALDVEGVTGVVFAQNGRRLNAFEGTGLPTHLPLGRAAYPQATPR